MQVQLLVKNFLQLILLARLYFSYRYLGLNSRAGIHTKRSDELALKRLRWEARLITSPLNPSNVFDYADPLTLDSTLRWATND